MTTDPELNDQQKTFVHYYCTGLTPPQAARKAGYQESYCRKASRLLKHPAIAEAIEATQAALRESQGYGPAEAVKEINSQIKLALAAKSPNFMAAAKNLDLKCRIFGLVKEKIEVATVDLASAIRSAEARVFDVTPRQGPQLTESERPSVLTMTGGTGGGGGQTLSRTLDKRYLPSR
jgi:phage terminase small subunit